MEQLIFPEDTASLHTPSQQSLPPVPAVATDDPIPVDDHFEDPEQQSTDKPVQLLPHPAADPSTCSKQQRQAAANSTRANKQPRLFLDIFAGLRCPFTKAMHQLGGDYLAPFDYALRNTHDILDDRVMRLLQKLCFSGIVGVAWSAPPCKEFSRLKLKRPGPKPLRAPQRMDGVPGLSPAEQARVDASTEIHRRPRTLLRAVFSTAGQAGLELPSSAMSWLQEDNIAMLREWSAHVADVSACSHGLDFYKIWAFCASFESIASLASVCAHPPGAHQSIAGKQLHGKFVSELTAEYPSSLAAQLPFVRLRRLLDRLRRLLDRRLRPKAHESSGRGRHEQHGRSHHPAKHPTAPSCIRMDSVVRGQPLAI